MQVVSSKSGLQLWSQWQLVHIYDSKYSNIALMLAKSTPYKNEKWAGHYPMYEQYWSIYYFNVYADRGKSINAEYLRASFPGILDGIGGIYVAKSKDGVRWFELRLIFRSRTSDMFSWFGNYFYIFVKKSNCFTW